MGMPSFDDFDDFYGESFRDGDNSPMPTPGGEKGATERLNTSDLPPLEPYADWGMSTIDRLSSQSDTKSSSPNRERRRSMTRSNSRAKSKASNSSGQTTSGKVPSYEHFPGVVRPRPITKSQTVSAK